MKPFNLISGMYIDFDVENNDKDPEFKFGDHMRILKYKSEKVCVVKKVKNTVQWTSVIRDRKGEEIVETFYENKLQKMNQIEFRIEKSLNRKGLRLFVKCHSPKDISFS